MTRAPRIDLVIALAVLVLMGLGMVMVASSSWAFAAEKFGDPYFYTKRHAAYLVPALLGLFAGVLVRPSRYAHWAYPMLGFGLLLLCVVLIPGVGAAAGIARRWIVIGPITLQPGEPVKFILLVYLAMSLAKKGTQMSSFTVGLLPHVLVPGAVILLLLCQPDFGTALMLSTPTLILLFVGGARIVYLIVAACAVLPMALFLISSSAYRMRRILAFLEPWAHRHDEGYQIIESLLTFGSGGAFGLGLGDGRQKLFFLPAAHTDFILAVIGEELGFAGVGLVLGCFAVILVRGLRTALRHPDAFRSYLALGITALFVLQAAFNVAVVTGLVPTKGLTLPFISSGGSSLIVSAFLGGVLARLSGDAEGDLGVERTE
ncbi:MAG: putative lipid II flippase FtsW, partial [Myxococcota bacterium]